MSDVTIRIYVRHADGEMELLLEASTSYFGGFCPSVGDVLSFFRDSRHFEVVSRTFLTSDERDKGWAIVCDEVTGALHASTAITWALDNDWARDIDLQIIQERAREARKVLKEKNRKKRS